MKPIRLLLAVQLAACTTPNPNYCPSRNCGDAMDDKSTIYVALAGNDNADGITAPVKTVKRAIELAAANTAIKTIRIDTGKYGAANGETYPYTVPTGVKVVGAAGTILAGTSVEEGLVVDTGAVENLQLTDFMTAVHVTGVATLAGLTVIASPVGVLANGSANVTATALTFAGMPAQCTVGLRAVDTAQVAVDTLVATNLTALHGRDQSAIAVSKGTISSTSACNLAVVSGKSLTLTDTTLSGGSDAIFLNGETGVQPNLELSVILNNTAIIDAARNAVEGAPQVFRMTGGELRNNGISGARIFRAMSTFTNISVKDNKEFGVRLSDGASLAMRGCSIQGNGRGLVLGPITANLGTTLEPGNNVIRNNAGVGVEIYGQPSQIIAVGNRWNSSVQGASADGTYAPQLIAAPVPPVPGNNYSLLDSANLQL